MRRAITQSVANSLKMKPLKAGILFQQPSNDVGGKIGRPERIETLEIPNLEGVAAARQQSKIGVATADKIGRPRSDFQVVTVERVDRIKVAARADHHQIGAARGKIEVDGIVSE